IAAFTLDPDAATGLIQVHLDDRQFGPFQLYQYTGFAYAAPAQTAATAAAPAHVTGVIGFTDVSKYSYQDGPGTVIVEVVQIAFDGFPIHGTKIVHFRAQRPNGGVPLRDDPWRQEAANKAQAAAEPLKVKMDELYKMLGPLLEQEADAEANGDS